MFWKFLYARMCCRQGNSAAMYINVRVHIIYTVGSLHRICRVRWLLLSTLIYGFYLQSLALVIIFAPACSGGVLWHIYILYGFKSNHNTHICRYAKGAFPKIECPLSLAYFVVFISSSTLHGVAPLEQRFLRAYCRRSREWEMRCLYGAWCLLGRLPRSLISDRCASR